MQVMRIAVIGATGFLGSALVTKLRKLLKREVVIFDRRAHSLFDTASLKPLIFGCDAIYHLAAINNSKDPRILKINILGTWKVLEAVRKYSPSAKFIFASSFAVYKTPNKKIAIDESHPATPRNIYGFTKLIGEKLCLFYSKLFGIDVAIARMSNIYGPSMPSFKHSAVATFVEKIRNGKTVEISGDGEQTRDFIHIDDVVNALVSLGEKENARGLFNICSGDSVSINRVISLIERKFKKKVKRVYQGKVKREYWKGSNEKAKKLLLWKPNSEFRI